MALPLLATRPITQNARVNNFAIGSDEAPRPQVTVDEQIEQAYRQIFFHAFKVDREPMLEMQLRNGDISVREFVRGLLLSRKFREGFYRCNSNYRVVEQVVGRVLGREVHGDQERIAWSIVIANKGLEGLVDALLDSPEYLENFGATPCPFSAHGSWPAMPGPRCPSTRRRLATTLTGVMPAPAAPPPAPSPVAALSSAAVRCRLPGWVDSPPSWLRPSGLPWRPSVAWNLCAW